MRALASSLLFSLLAPIAVLAQAESAGTAPAGAAPVGETKPEKPRSKFVKKPGNAAKKEGDGKDGPKPTEPDPVEQGPPIKPVLRVSPDVMAAQFFREALSPYGEWFELKGYGRCWKPKGLSPGWAPYTVGEWAYSNYGWTWVSAEDFGDIVHHYGRWIRLRGHGWTWIPDLEWAASWVGWRYGTKQIGWCPLPPQSKWNPSTGVGPWIDRDYEIGPENYVFCQIPDFGNEMLHKVLLPSTQNADAFLHTVNITNISLAVRNIFVGGPSFDWIATRSVQPVSVIRVAKERSLIKFRELLQTASENATEGPAAFRSVLRESSLTLVAPEWGILSDPRRAESLGFHVDEPDEKSREGSGKRVWREGAQASDPEPVVVDPNVVVVVPSPLNGWENLNSEEEKKTLKAKVAREVAGMNADRNPARPFDPKRDTPTVRR
jgi:hypothetical protein